MLTAVLFLVENREKYEELGGPPVKGRVRRPIVALVTSKAKRVEQLKV